MNTEQLHRIQHDKGFIAALDQSGGSTPKALATYGVSEDQYSGEEQMYDMVHQMRTRIVTDEAFDKQYILGAILFKQTMRSQIEGLDTADYLWQKKGVVPFLKIDNGLADLEQGVHMMKPMPELQTLLDEANEKHIFGTKMRSVIKEYNEAGIQAVVEQQFEVAKRICAAGLVPIIEPEVDIHSAEKQKIEAYLHQLLTSGLDDLAENELVMLKLTLPTEANTYHSLTTHPNVVRVVALSGGYPREEANELLSRNNGVIASFSRALSEGLSAQQTDEEFTATLAQSIDGIYTASIS